LNTYNFIVAKLNTNPEIDPAATAVLGFSKANGNMNIRMKYTPLFTISPVEFAPI
jgi:hypothetical protein